MLCIQKFSEIIRPPFFPFSQSPLEASLFSSLSTISNMKKDIVDQFKSQLLITAPIISNQCKVIKQQLNQIQDENGVLDKQTALEDSKTVIGETQKLKCLFQGKIGEQCKQIEKFIDKNEQFNSTQITSISVKRKFNQEKFDYDLQDSPYILQISNQIKDTLVNQNLILTDQNQMIKFIPNSIVYFKDQSKPPFMLLTFQNIRSTSSLPLPQFISSSNNSIIPCVTTSIESPHLPIFSQCHSLFLEQNYREYPICQLSQSPLLNDLWQQFQSSHPATELTPTVLHKLIKFTSIAKNRQIVIKRNIKETIKIFKQQQFITISDNQISCFSQLLEKVLQINSQEYNSQLPRNQSILTTSSFCNLQLQHVKCQNDDLNQVSSNELMRMFQRFTITLSQSYKIQVLVVHPQKKDLLIFNKVICDFLTQCQAHQSPYLIYGDFNFQPTDINIQQIVTRFQCILVKPPSPTYFPTQCHLRPRLLDYLITNICDVQLIHQSRQISQDHDMLVFKIPLDKIYTHTAIPLPKMPEQKLLSAHQHRHPLYLNRNFTLQRMMSLYFTFTSPISPPSCLHYTLDKELSLYQEDKDQYLQKAIQSNPKQYVDFKQKFSSMPSSPHFLSQQFEKMSGHSISRGKKESSVISKSALHQIRNRMRSQMTQLYSTNQPKFISIYQTYPEIPYHLLFPRDINPKKGTSFSGITLHTIRAALHSPSLSKQICLPFLKSIVEKRDYLNLSDIGRSFFLLKDKTLLYRQIEANNKDLRNIQMPGASKLIDTCFQKALKMNQQLIMNTYPQQSVKSNQGTQTAHLIFQQYIRANLDAQYNTLSDVPLFAAIFIDCSKAFDTINHNHLKSKLITLSPNSLKDYYKFRQIQILNDQISVIDKLQNNLIHQTVGVKQGGTKSPFEYSFCMTDLESCISQSFAQQDINDILILQYIDDVLILVPIQQGDNNLLDRLEQSLYDSFNRLSYINPEYQLNPTKSSMLILDPYVSTRERLSPNLQRINLIVNQAQANQLTDRLNFKIQAVNILNSRLNFKLEKSYAYLGLHCNLSLDASNEICRLNTYITLYQCNLNRLLQRTTVTLKQNFLLSSYHLFSHLFYRMTWLGKMSPAQVKRYQLQFMRSSIGMHHSAPGRIDLFYKKIPINSLFFMAIKSLKEMHEIIRINISYPQSLQRYLLLPDSSLHNDLTWESKKSALMFSYISESDLDKMKINFKEMNKKNVKPLIGNIYATNSDRLTQYAPDIIDHPTVNLIEQNDQFISTKSSLRLDLQDILILMNQLKGLPLYEYYIDQNQQQIKKFNPLQNLNSLFERKSINYLKKLMRIELEFGKRVQQRYRLSNLTQVIRMNQNSQYEKFTLSQLKLY